MSYSRYVLPLICCALILISACAAKPDKEEYEMTNYHRALNNTDPQKTESLQPGSEKEKEAIERFTSFYRVFSLETVTKGVRNVYAINAYFRDGYREVQGLENIEAYFLKSTETIHECTFDIDDVAVHQGNYYFRWVMHLIVKRWKDEPIAAVGMSHVRFDTDGKISFHQDYWDTSIIYERVPVMGSIIRRIKKQF